MNPKEKAEELVFKYYDLFKRFIFLDEAKICAIISINELIEESYFTDGYYDRQEYWEEVKQEIEKL